MGSFLGRESVSVLTNSMERKFDGVFDKYVSKWHKIGDETKASTTSSTFESLMKAGKTVGKNLKS